QGGGSRRRDHPEKDESQSPRARLGSPALRPRATLRGLFGGRGPSLPGAAVPVAADHACSSVCAADALVAAARRMRGTAAGTDNWSPKDAPDGRASKALPFRPLRLVELLHLVEQIGRWPSAFSDWRLVFIAKPVSAGAGPVMCISAVLYPAWGRSLLVAASSESGTLPVGVLLDFCKAFDSVDWAVALRCTVHAGLPLSVASALRGMWAGQRRWVQFGSCVHPRALSASELKRASRANAVALRVAALPLAATLVAPLAVWGSLLGGRCLTNGNLQQHLRRCCVAVHGLAFSRGRASPDLRRVLDLGHTSDLAFVAVFRVLSAVDRWRRVRGGASSWSAALRGGARWSLVQSPRRDAVCARTAPVVVSSQLVSSLRSVASRVGGHGLAVLCGGMLTD
ncbi:unnamed protein product, partial [Effrenium voratum]